MVLFRALGWLLLAMAVGAAVNDGLVWWSEGSLHPLALGEFWSRLDFDSLDHAQSAIQRHLSAGLWNWVATPLLRLPALPIFTIAGVLLLWLGRRIGNNPPETGLLGSRPTRRRRARSGLS